MPEPTENLRNTNRTLRILEDAVKGNYGVLAAICYNIEHLTAIVKAAEAKRSPLVLLLFPSTLRQLPTLAWAASAAIKSATVPLSLHLDHAQDVSQIEEVVKTLPFDSIMVDMSHYDHEENLAKTAALTKLCHKRGIAVEAESGRINGGEDGIADTDDLEENFLKAGIDILAPSVGNIHGDYGPKGPDLDLARLSSIDKQIRGHAFMALHGTNDFTAQIMQDCIKAGAVKLNVNKLLLEVWHVHLKENAHKPFMQRVDEGIEILQAEVERWIDICGSTGKA
ncbi:tagatose 1,6-diphosphate aldolase [Fusarium oxysporum f. sp. raphani 54005]|uniref:Fructose-bisphosphate aldolase n=2 Tax=Fusarium oxysporum TaxID=5507 RepID=X0BZ86_FUSOX|nr:tagatose 1,6-diphosphate aldolase [Fusarium oxysporum f. sp. pisi HDV247]EXK87500.1 tagatose 1,6-diphosphate aldolase [Fusarium oxysporum f. sp. raphani 54005]